MVAPEQHLYQTIVLTRKHEVRDINVFSYVGGEVKGRTDVIHTIKIKWRS